MKSPNRLSIAASLFLGIGYTSTSQAANDFPQQLEFNGKRLELIGAGIAYYKRLIPVYDAALFSIAGKDSDQILDASTPRCLVLKYRRSVPPEAFSEAAEIILNRQIENLTPLRDRLNSFFSAFEEVEKNDQYQLCYSRRTATELSFNGDTVISIRGEDFARAYFGIWLAENGLSEDLREDLLGNPRMGKIRDARN